MAAPSDQQALESEPAKEPFKQPEMQLKRCTLDGDPESAPLASFIEFKHA